MEKVQKACTAISQVGEPDQYGNLAYSVTFNDGESGFFRCKEQNLFTVGQSSEFYFGKTTGKSGKEYYKIERVEKHENNFDNSGKNFHSGGGNTSSKKSGDNEKFMCLSYAKDIFIAFNGKMPSPTELTSYAEVLYSETKNGKEEAKPDGHAQALVPPTQAPPQADTNVLPF